MNERRDDGEHKRPSCVYIYIYVISRRDVKKEEEKSCASTAKLLRRLSSERRARPSLLIEKQAREGVKKEIHVRR